MATHSTDPKITRDLLYTWLYVTVSKIGEIKTTDKPSDVADKYVNDLGALNSNGKPHVTIQSGDTLYQDMIDWITYIQSNDANLVKFANLLKHCNTAKLLSQPWSSGPDHPKLGELDGSFQDL